MGGIWRHTQWTNTSKSSVPHQAFHTSRLDRFLDNGNNGCFYQAMLLWRRQTYPDWASWSKDHRRFLPEDGKSMARSVSVEKGSTVLTRQQVASTEKARDNRAQTTKDSWTRESIQSADGGNERAQVFKKAVTEGSRGVQRSSPLHIPSCSSEAREEEHTCPYSFQLVCSLSRTLSERLLDEGTRPVEQPVRSRSAI